ncbi:MAG: hypothetical protein E6J90_50790 [Deltaproteobacteria bacterium]|nr:MAG: hypothetical protein E6J90_50790 [Deltaproteobacteria bacterium]
MGELSFVALGVVASVAGLVGGCGGDSVMFSNDHPRIYLQRNKDRLAAALSSGQPAAKRFKGAVDRWVAGEDVYNFSPWNAALIGQLTGDPKYCAAAIKSVDQQVRDAEMQVKGGNTPEVAGDSYLGVGNLIGNLALVYDWCAGALPGDRRAAWLTYADQAVYNVWNYQMAQWGGKPAMWSGWAIDDPSDNYYYSFMRATMLLGLAAHDETPRASGWLTEFQDKIHGELVPTFDKDLVGGGSREGTGYGVAMRDMFELYDFWAGSTGQRIADLTKHTRASMLSFIHQTVPTLDRIAPTGDQSRDSTASFFDYHRSYLQDLIALFPGDPVAPHAQALLANCSVPEMGSEFMFASDFLYANTNVAATALDGLGTAYYAPGIGELYARSGWDKHATWINLIAGPYTQSHAHQDQGSLLIYKDGWLAYDAVVESHSGLPQATTAHSVIRIVDGAGKTIEQGQTDQPRIVALHRGNGFLHAAADVTAVYQGKSLVQKVQREIVYLPPSAIVVYDRVTTTAGSQVFQLVTPASPQIGTPSSTLTASGHTLNVQRVSVPTGTTPSVYDFAASDPDHDFSAGFRLDETAPAGDNRFLHVLWIDSAAGAVTLSGSDGVTLTVGSQAVTVQFNRNSVGGSIMIGAQTTTLGTGVDTLPE